MEYGKPSKGKFNISLERITGKKWKPNYYDSLIHEEEFSCYPGDHGERRDKVFFESMDEIPCCKKYSYPEGIERVDFYHPLVSDDWPVMFLDAGVVLSNMGVQAFNIHPIRWDKVKGYVSKGLVEYPEISKDLSPLDGRHRTIALVKAFGVKWVPFVCDPEYLERVFDKAREQGALREKNI